MKRVSEKTDYPFVLDHKPGFFLNLFLYRLFKRVNLNENMKEALKTMQKQGTVVYAVKYRGLLDYLLYHYTFRHRRLPYPKIAFDHNISLVLPLGRLFRVIGSQISSLFRYGKIPSPYKTGFYQRAIKGRTTALVSLIDPVDFTRSFVHSEKDHLQFLIETQMDMDRPIFLVPQLIIFTKTPEKSYSSLSDILFGYRDYTGLIRKVILFFRHHPTTFIDFGSPLNLKDFLKNQPPERSVVDMASEIRQTLIERIDVQKRVILGPIMKSRQQLKEIVLRDENINKLIERMASGDPKKLKQNRKKAGEYFDEIAADYNTAYVQTFRLALRWLWKRIFEGFDVDQSSAAGLREWARRGPLIYIPSHKSHIDYLVLNYILYDFHMHVPRIAAGQNLSFWPMGRIFRKSGAFFIRRSFRGARLYSEVFSRYIKSLLQDGYPVEFFIEGGRSRIGKLTLPKTGFLAILLKAYEEGFCRDLIFVPTSIIYDRIIEKSSYLKEISGGRKEKETLSQIIKARRLLKRRYGKIYIRFSAPFSLREYLSERNLEVKEAQWELAYHLVKSINDVSLVTPLSLVSTAILANHRRGFYISELEETVNILLGFLKKNHIPMAATLNDPSKAVLETISLLMAWKVVDMMEDAPGDEETFYFVDDDKKMELEYYKNSIIHFFIHHSFAAISFLTGSDEVKSVDSVVSDYLFLKETFVNEFVFDRDEDVQEKIKSIIDFFLDSRFLTIINEDKGYRVTRQGFDKLPIWASLTKTFIESYWITANAMLREKEGKMTGENLLKKVLYLGKRYHRMGIVEHMGALSRINFENAVTMINRNILGGRGNKDEGGHPNLEGLSHLSKRLYEISHFGQ